MNIVAILLLKKVIGYHIAKWYGFKNVYRTLSKTNRYFFKNTNIYNTNRDKIQYLFRIKF
jgi:hypothetical protein